MLPSDLSAAIQSNNVDQMEINRIKRDYHEPAPEIDANEFHKIVESRRSIRRFLEEPIPGEVMQKCFHLAHLAPNSSSLQPWEFYWIRNPEKKRKLGEICMNQPAATTAPELIVCVARTDTWRMNSKLLLEEMKRTSMPSPSTVTYYSKLLPLQLSTGFLGWTVVLKWFLFNMGGLMKPMMRFPLGPTDRKIWAIKSTALACENLMLALRAYGYDSCPMEGYDEVRLKRLLDLPRGAHPILVIGAGKRKPGGVYGPRIRLPLERFFFEVR